MPDPAAGVHTVPGWAWMTSSRGRRARVAEPEPHGRRTVGEAHRLLDVDLGTPVVAEERAELVEGGVEVVDDDADVELVGGVHGSSTTRSAPERRSAATRKASSASSSGKRWVIRVRAISGSSASMAAASSISRPPSWRQ